MHFGRRALLTIAVVTAVWVALIHLARPVAFLLFALAAFNAVSLPAILVLLGLTSRQNGTVLEVKSNPVFMALLTTWTISVLLCGSFYVAAWLQASMR
ncbi:hypothetical protein [Stieleria mannarensis]|uniref:hypothetical protein n=1 Tax=Stieleria mannarensis TaxID=2755585 RepID=UPI0016038A68|nr:hypothetical protein [Rhodopirellula sp. JC639]